MLKQVADIVSSGPSTLSPPRWQETKSLELVYQMNERFLELMSQVPPSSRFANTNLWSKLDAYARKRAARVPFVMADVRFTDPRWWLDRTNPEIVTLPMEQNSARLPSSVSQPLIHETLMLAWHAAHSSVHAASITVGMSLEVAKILGEMTAQEVRAFAITHNDEVGPRWSNVSDLWEHWLDTARQGNDAGLAMVHLYSKLLLCGEMRTQQSVWPRKLEMVS